MARITKRTLVGVLAIILTFAIVQTIASERVEVVELTTTDEGGKDSTTRLWIVDHDGVEYLRAGADNAGSTRRARRARRAASFSRPLPFD